MTKTLLLRFAGDAQSWSSSSGRNKHTEGVPTRNGVLGLLGASLGAERGEMPAWLHATDIVARVDRPGTVVVDFHTVSNPPEDVGRTRTRQRIASGTSKALAAANYTVPNGQGRRWGDASMLTERAYLSGAEFLVAISHPDDDRLDQLAAAAWEPVFMTYLGRKAFAPSFPFYLGVHHRAAHDLLATIPTSTAGGRRLPIHAIEQDRNYANSYVTPTVAVTQDDLWKGWRPE
ncbi:type I-E CRISPR-associated protein Cas5/CasD [Frigoribacterium sp. SL97]|uniref:type I-E CRISPR-associated protein Cas5/CasD n=1 Tax=Frigoribacterium sp. SL97 TaxID=2994664 RepID=UPI00226E1A3C|nr:type I-E CRISPR-associated protein Cas5/CasD [Frigoribacterium sp. SL97]WAC50252.1 type I-E CRISPR-associated protein Cas5/CasD [Frigoribacterium sp. SL97]